MIETLNYQFNGNIRILNVFLSCVDLIIKTGDSCTVTAIDVDTNYFKEVTAINGILTVKQSLNLLRIPNLITPPPKVEITIPRESKLQNMTIKFSAGRVRTKDISTEDAVIGMSAGAIKLYKFSANKLKLTNSSGAITMEQANLKNINISTSAGNLKIQGRIGGNNKISSSVSNIELQLAGFENDYFISHKASVGHLNVNNRKTFSPIGTADSNKIIKIATSVGNVNINFDGGN